MDDHELDQLKDVPRWKLDLLDTITAFATGSALLVVVASYIRAGLAVWSGGAL